MGSNPIARSIPHPHPENPYNVARYSTPPTRQGGIPLSSRPRLLAVAALCGALSLLVTGASLQAPAAVAIQKKVLLPDGAPQVTANVRVADLLGDGTTQIFATEPARGQVTWVKEDGEVVAFTEGLVQPVRTHVSDVDGDGDRDLLVADIGEIFPTDDLVGQVVLFRNDGRLNFERVVLLDGVGRVACAEAADFDGDGDEDIAVCVFGDVAEGKVVWLEQKEGFTFEEHVLDDRPGAIHAFPFDADGDGDLDIAVSLSQLAEEILLFRNGGEGDFTREVLFAAGDTDFGMSGLELADLDQDGDTDILFTNGDEGDKIIEGDPNDAHRLSWLENDGSGRFAVHDIIGQWGAYAVVAVDVDADGDLDIVLANHQIEEWHPDTEIQRLVWIENDGAERFTGHRVLDAPPLMLTIDAIETGSRPRIVGGSFNRCGLVDRECGAVGHRLVSFAISPGSLPAPAAPATGDSAVAALPGAAGAVGVVAIVLGAALLLSHCRSAGGGARRARTR